MDKSFQIQDEKYYTINEIADICGVSRATLLRLEESGFDRARVVSSASGYRYYDVINIHKVMQYRMLKKLGLDRNEIMAYYSGQMNSADFLATLKERLAIAKRCVDEFEARFTERESLQFSFYQTEEMTCYTFPCGIVKPKEQIEYNYLELQKMYAAGFHPYPTTPMFSVAPDPNTRFTGKMPKSFRSTMCVAIYPEPVPDPSRVLRFEARQTFSLLYHGNDDEIMATGGEILWDEMKKRGLRSAGPLYGICVVGPYFSTEIDPKDYVFRWAIPVEE